MWHRGPRASPLEPPFPGLAKTLTQLHIDAWDPEPLQQALHDYLPLSTREGNPVGYVSQRYPYQPRSPWEISEHNGKWHVYRALIEIPEIANAPDPDSVAATESEALRLAKAMLRAADHQLLKRLDFNDESSGTGISASAREDIERALTLLGLTAPWTPPADLIPRCASRPTTREDTTDNGPSVPVSAGGTRSHTSARLRHGKPADITPASREVCLDDRIATA